MSPKLSPAAAQRSLMIGSHRESAGQASGGCEIRTREGLHPTRFPTMRTSVHRGPPPSVTSPNTTGTVAGEWPRTGVNETETETRGWRRLTAAVQLGADGPSDGVQSPRPVATSSEAGDNWPSGMQPLRPGNGRNRRADGVQRFHPNSTGNRPRNPPPPPRARRRTRPGAGGGGRQTGEFSPRWVLTGSWRPPSGPDSIWLSPRC
jgi:hypothetical protein